jgi:hypothetical protein
MERRELPHERLLTSQVEFAQFSDKTYAIDDVAPSVFRFYNQNSQSHFYTQNKSEADYIFQNLSHFRFEGCAFNRNFTSSSDAVNIYRFYDAASGGHYFTENQTEANKLITQSDTMSFEGIAFQAHKSKVEGADEVHGFVNKHTGAHFYTANANEMANVQLYLSGTFTYEGIAYFSEAIG